MPRASAVLFCVAIVLGSLRAAGATTAARGAEESAIELWYGQDQHFGRLGNPQPRINVPGSVSPAAGIVALGYRLNGAPEKALTIGPDLRRLANVGDFNIEIERKDLQAGRNMVEIIARRADGREQRREVRVHYTPGRVWPLPFTIDWSGVSRISDVAEVMDGRWKLTPDGVRVLDPYYDRVLLVGDETWRDYEVLTSVIIHRFITRDVAARTPPFLNHAHASVLLRWRGHRDDGKQPRAQWRPCGGLAMWRVDAGKDGIYWVWHGGESGILATETPPRSFELGQRYLFRARVESLPGPKTRYSVRSWEAGQPEPATWDLVAIDGEKDLQSGSLALVAHHGDVTFGNIEVRPLTPAGREK